jgi:singapore isolate B (sub-type 7) whole genome shotgun sequence assembly, scaffold_7
VKQHITEAELRGKVLIFVSTRQAADELTSSLRLVTTASLDCLHGDKTQYDRSDVMNRFKKGSLRIVIATDVAARGLDVTDIMTGTDECDSLI